MPLLKWTHKRIFEHVIARSASDAAISCYQTGCSRPINGMRSHPKSTCSLALTAPRQSQSTLLAMAPNIQV